ncbi:MAG: hypothetical protein RID91_01695 [Azospirillaceae bacterium]
MPRPADTYPARVPARRGALAVALAGAAVVAVLGVVAGGAPARADVTDFNNNRLSNSCGTAVTVQRAFHEDVVLDVGETKPIHGYSIGAYADECFFVWTPGQEIPEGRTGQIQCRMVVMDGECRGFLDIDFNADGLQSLDTLRERQGALRAEPKLFKRDE